MFRLAFEPGSFVESIMVVGGVRASFETTDGDTERARVEDVMEATCG